MKLPEIGVKRPVATAMMFIAIILLGKPLAIAAYSFGLTTLFHFGTALLS